MPRTQQGTSLDLETRALATLRKPCAHIGQEICIDLRVQSTPWGQSVAFALSLVLCFATVVGEAGSGGASKSEFRPRSIKPEPATSAKENSAIWQQDGGSVSTK